MPRLAKSLNDTLVKNLKPKARLYKEADGKGLYIEVNPNGSKLWRFRYKFEGVEKMLSLGAYPDVSLSNARDKAGELRTRVANGVNPSEDRKQKKIELKSQREGVFKLVADSWLTKNAKTWSPLTARRVKQVLDNDLVPKLGEMSVGTLEAVTVKALLKTIYERAPKTAVKARQYCNQIIEHSVDEGLREESLAFNLSKALPKGAKETKEHFKAVTKVGDLPKLVKCINGISSVNSRAAVLVCLYTATRPGVVAGMRWAELDLNAKEWHIPATRMKTKNDHITPLPNQLIEIFKELKAGAGDSEFVFPSSVNAGRHIHRDSLSKILRENGLRGVSVTHGFRATLRTICRERLNTPLDVLEAQLAHAKKGEVAAAYDRTQFLEERHELVQKWADYLNAVASEEKVVQIPSKVA